MGMWEVNTLKDPTKMRLLDRIYLRPDRLRWRAHERSDFLKRGEFFGQVKDF